MNTVLEKYLNYVCPRCYSTLDQCKCVAAPYELIWIDRNIQEHIRILNQKGYMTGGCCESHYGAPYSTSMHVVFVHSFGLGEVVPIPDGFTYDRKRRALMFQYKQRIAEKEMQSQKEEKLTELLQWCNELRPFKEVVDILNATRSKGE